MAKTYYFSVRKHAHDIEFYRNRLFNTMKDMESGEIPMDKKRYDRIYAMYNALQRDLLQYPRRNHGAAHRSADRPGAEDRGVGG